MAQIDMFLKLGSIKGESKQDGHVDEMEVQGTQISITNHGTFGSSGGGGAGKASLSDLPFSKPIDKSTPEIMKACFNSDHIPEATITLRKGGKKPLDYLIIKLKDVKISSFSQSIDGDGSVIPTDHFSLNFTKIDYEYKPQKQDGTLAGGVKVAFDVSTGKTT